MSQAVLLKNQSIDELKKSIKTIYDKIIKDLTPEQRNQLKYDDVIQKAYNLYREKNIVEIEDISISKRGEVSECIFAVVRSNDGYISVLHKGASKWTSANGGSMTIIS